MSVPCDNIYAMWWYKSCKFWSIMIFFWMYAIYPLRIHRMFTWNAILSFLQQVLSGINGVEIMRYMHFSVKCIENGTSCTWIHILPVDGGNWCHSFCFFTIFNDITCYNNAKKQICSDFIDEFTNSTTVRQKTFHPENQ